MKNNFRNKFSTSRQGFTLVELLVSMALILFIMSIISAVFVDSSESFRLFRGRMELSEKLRVITQTLRMDLRANHFGDGRKLSDNDFWDQGPPQIGYFRIEQKNPGFAVQSSDSTDQIITALPTDGHALLFSSFLYGGDNRGYFSTALPSTLGNSSTPGTFKFCSQNFLKSADSRFEEGEGEFKSPDAEIAWFLGAGATDVIVLNDEPGTPSVTLNRLYRRRWLLLPTPPSSPFVLNASEANELAQDKTKAILSHVPGTNPVTFNFIDTPEKQSIDVPQRRILGNYMSPANFRQAGWNSSLAGNEDSLIADNVLSFTVEVWNPLTNKFGTLKDYYDSLTTLPLAQRFSYTTINSHRVYDTWSSRDLSPASNNYSRWNDSNDLSNSVPVPIKPASGNNSAALPVIQAIRVTIRLYDWRTKSTAQATVIEAP